jgi:DNA-binding MarR family transcriptional regulator
MTQRRRKSPGPRYLALLDLLRTSETLWNASRILFARWDLSPSQFNVLNLLQDHPEGASQTELSRQLIMHRSNVTGLVDRLEARGLVCRLDDNRDRRAFKVVLTESGHKLLQQIEPHYYEAAETVWGAISAGRARKLVAELGSLGANAARMAEELTGNK